MNITYMIGNGFDVALGLKTQYSDFLAHYCGLDKSKNPILRRFQEEIKKDDCDLWSCAEKAFGEMDWSGFAKSNSTETVKAFRECLIDFQRELESYLRSQWKRFVLPEGRKGEELARGCLGRMFHLEKFMGSRFAHEYRQFVVQHGQINIRFIVFNYTDILEQLWASIPPRQNDGVHVLDIKYGNTIFPSEMEQPCFVHGVFSRSKFLFGVDNANQIKDESIRAECERTGSLVKPYMDADSGLGYDDRARELIESSDVIVTFGLSFGESDRSWWERLYQHVFGRERMLVICPYYKSEHEVLNSGDAAMIDRQEAVRRLFSSLGGDNKYKLDINRNRVKRVRLLDDIETDVGNDIKTRCDYFDLHALGQATVKGEQEIAQ